MKKTITLEAIDPLEIYGSGNRIFEALCSYFPDLKAVARGNEIHLEGSGEVVMDKGLMEAARRPLEGCS